MRSANWLTFQGRQFRAACHGYRVSQEFFQTYTRDQDAPIDLFFNTFKEQCVCQQDYRDTPEVG